MTFWDFAHEHSVLCGGLAFFALLVLSTLRLEVRRGPAPSKTKGDGDE